MFIICLENISRKIQHASKVNYVKIFLVKHVSSQTQQKFLNQTKLIYNINIFSQSTLKHNQRLKNEFGNSLNLQQRNQFTGLISEPIFNFTEPVFSPPPLCPAAYSKP